jgi:hypothetical protein
VSSEDAQPASLADHRLVGPFSAFPPDQSASNITHLTPQLIDLPLGGLRRLPGSPVSPLALSVPPGDVLIVAGLPGAGKTTLLRAAAGVDDVVLDPQEVSERLPAGLRAIPYGAIRPAVHAVHRLLVLSELARGTRFLVIHEPGGYRRWRRLLVWLARRRGRSVHLLVIVTDPATARAARVRRARTLPPRRATRHEREWALLHGELARGWPGSRLAREGYSGCTLLPRSAIPAVVSLRGGTSL